MPAHRSRPARLVLLLLGALACGGGPGGGEPGKGGMGGEDGERLASPDQRILVETAEAARGSVADHLVTTGVLESEAQADISPEASGNVTRVLVEEGDSVRAGQLLAVIASPSLDAGADRAGIELERSRQALAEAQALHGSGAISDRELRDAQNAVRVAETSYQEANRSAGFTQLTSPIAGTLSLRNVRVGEMASPGAPAFQVVDLSRLRVVIQLPEKDLPRVKEGLNATLSGAYDDAAQASGRVERISPVVDASTGTVRVTIAVDPQGATLRPGQFVKVRVEVDRHDDVLTIQRRGLVWEDGEPIAWVVADAKAPEVKGDDAETEGDKEKEEGGFFADLFAGDDNSAGEEAEEAADPWEGIPRREAQKRRLTIGFVDPDQVEVLTGLEAGDPVVVLGNNALREGTLVRLEGDPDPPKPDKDKADKDKGDGAGASGEG